MMRIALIALLLLPVSFSGNAQIEDENRNALPPGPARISGYVLLDGEPVENAVVRLEYCRDSKKLQRDFQIYGRGEYTVYINKGSTEVVIKVLVNGKVVSSFEPKYHDEGSVQRKNFELSKNNPAFKK